MYRIMRSREVIVASPPYFSFKAGMSNRRGIERFSPELVCIEAAAEQKAILRYFAENGYERIDRYLKFDFANWYFRPRDER